MQVYVLYSAGVIFSGTSGTEGLVLWVDFLFIQCAFIEWKCSRKEGGKGHLSGLFQWIVFKYILELYWSLGIGVYFLWADLL